MIPNWVWYLAGAIAITFTLIYVVGIIWGFRRFRQMDKDFNEQRDRVRRNLRRGSPS